ncbi:MAG: hypothetical protein ACTTH7_09065 [Treponema sp.]
MNVTRKLPIGVQSFKDLRENIFYMLIKQRLSGNLPKEAIHIS